MLPNLDYNQKSCPGLNNVRRLQDRLSCAVPHG
jgi:hypothetical protein